MEGLLRNYKIGATNYGHNWRKHRYLKKEERYDTGNAGGILLKKPKRGWYTLFENNEAAKVLELLCCEDFRKALAEIAKTGKTVFTLSSLCLACNIQNPGVLEEKLKESKLFSVNQPEIDGKPVTIYELLYVDRLFLLFAILCYATEHAEFHSCYMCCANDLHFYVK